MDKVLAFELKAAKTADSRFNVGCGLGDSGWARFGAHDQAFNFSTHGLLNFREAGTRERADYAEANTGEEDEGHR
jgi:hypothetical protein